MHCVDSPCSRGHRYSLVVAPPIFSPKPCRLLQREWPRRISTKPGFTGVWQLNIPESKSGKNSPLNYYASFKQEIKQTGNRIDIREDLPSAKGVHRMSVFAFLTDGRPYKPRAGLTGTVSGKWKGDTLIEWFRDEGGEVVRKLRLAQNGKQIFADWQFTPANRMPQVATELRRLTGYTSVLRSP